MSKYFIYDMETGDFDIRNNEEEALKFARELIVESMDDGEWLARPQVYIGIITHQTIEKKVSIRPKPEDIDEDGYAKDGYNYDNDYDAYYDYVMEKVDNG